MQQKALALSLFALFLTTLFTAPDGIEGIEAGSSLDGILAPNEYQFNGTFADGSIQYHWKVVNDTIHFAMVGKTNGWVAIGIGYTQAMENSDMIFGWVEDGGTTHVVDAYSTGPTGPHPRDTDQGGTNDITSFGGREINGTTTIEFVRKLDTGDEKDNAIPKNGTLRILWAYGGTDSFDVQHTRSGYGTIDIGSGETTSKDKVELWPYHALFMTLVVAGMATAWIAQHRKKWKPFMKYHMRTMIGSVVSGFIGLMIAYIMIERGTGLHLRVFHAWIGIVAILAAFTALGLALIFKYSQFVKAKRPALKIHKPSGKTGVSLFVVAAIFGIYQALILSSYELPVWFIIIDLAVILATIGLIIYIFIKSKPKPAPPRSQTPPKPSAVKPA